MTRQAAVCCRPPCAADRAVALVRQPDPSVVEGARRCRLDDSRDGRCRRRRRRRGRRCRRRCSPGRTHAETRRLGKCCCCQSHADPASRHSLSCGHRGRALQDRCASGLQHNKGETEMAVCRREKPPMASNTHAHKDQDKLSVQVQHMHWTSHPAAVSNALPCARRVV